MYKAKYLPCNTIMVSDTSKSTEEPSPALALGLGSHGGFGTGEKRSEALVIGEGEWVRKRKLETGSRDRPTGR